LSGNEGTAKSEFIIKIDTEAPLTPIIFSPLSGSNIKETGTKLVGYTSPSSSITYEMYYQVDKRLAGRDLLPGTPSTAYSAPLMEIFISNFDTSKSGDLNFKTTIVDAADLASIVAGTHYYLVVPGTSRPVLALTDVNGADVPISCYAAAGYCNVKLQEGLVSGLVKGKKYSIYSGASIQSVPGMFSSDVIFTEVLDGESLDMIITSYDEVLNSAKTELTNLKIDGIGPIVTGNYPDTVTGNSRTSISIYLKDNGGLDLSTLHLYHSVGGAAFNDATKIELPYSYSITGSYIVISYQLPSPREYSKTETNWFRLDGIQDPAGNPRTEGTGVIYDFVQYLLAVH
jgi:hypothetical protein